jgi:hypothetical protein
MLLSVHCRLEKRSQVTVNCSQSWQQASPQETGMPKTDNNSLLSQIDTIARGLSETFSPFCEVVVHDLKILNMPFYPSIIICPDVNPASQQPSLAWRESHRLTFPASLRTTVISLPMVAR